MKIVLCALCVPVFAIRGGLSGWKHRHNFTPKWGPKTLGTGGARKLPHRHNRQKNVLSLIKNDIVLAFLPPQALLMNKKELYSLCAGIQACTHTHMYTMFSLVLPIYSWKMFKYVNVKMFLLSNQCNHI